MPGDPDSAALVATSGEALPGQRQAGQRLTVWHKAKLAHAYRGNAAWTVLEFSRS
ncbi:hypothetical protein ACFXI3_14645 [Amycolatopsis sp. NPDC059235]|uniref:hypothetical protein n=1 Tax=Amycolatopsis sp. NPDC059235 TaxID=3346782 RepID=UPI00366BB53D